MARVLLAEEPVAIVGVGCAGPMTRGGVEVSPLNIPSWRDFPLRRSLRDALDLDVFIDGDARSLALAEGAFGAARDDSSYLSMVVSTGVGGGFVIDRRLLDGDSGNSGHIGHLNVVPDGRICSCGAFGCLEAEASGWAIEAMTGSPGTAGRPGHARANGESGWSRRRHTRVGARFQSLLRRGIGRAGLRRRVLRSSEQVGARHGPAALFGAP